MLARVSKILLLLIVAELCLGGGGRFTAIGPVSLRMVLFGVAVLITLAMMAQGEKIPSRYWKLIVGFGLAMTIGLIVGLLNDSSRTELWEDVKPLLYFLILPFFALTVGKKEVEVISKIIKSSSVILIVIFFLLLILIHTGAIPFLTFYHLTYDKQELFYRGELSFFYKGFLFFGIGVIFFFFGGARNKTYTIAFLIAAILLSVTRGLIFSLAITFAIYFFHERNFYRGLSCSVAALVILIWGNQVTINVSRWLDSSKKQTSFSKSSPHLFGDREYSDDGRVTQAKEVLHAITLPSAVIGHGFGQGTPSRPVHMEIAYLEVFHKQGIIGLAFWATVAVIIFLTFRNSDQGPLSKAFLLSSLFVFVESATNQYFNNPIGLSVLLLSLVGLDKLKKEV